jgi:penicillin-binding protein 1A
VDYLGVIRAGLANVGRLKSQGASTITMQVARNVYLSSEKTYTRKIYEILLTFKLEHLLTKDQILEIYMNQIFLGNRAYGFAAASEAYFGKPLKDISIAEAAMLAGLPKAPSAYNPISNPKRARSRQLYIIERMEENGFITAGPGRGRQEGRAAVRRSTGGNVKVHAEYVAETVRQLVHAQYGDETYTRGLNVYTTLKPADQERRLQGPAKGHHGLRAPPDLPRPREVRDTAGRPQGAGRRIDDALTDHPDNGDVMSAVVLEATPSDLRHAPERASIEITGEGLRPCPVGLSDKAPPKIKIRRGAVIRVVKTPKNTWEITQLPEVEGRFRGAGPARRRHARAGGRL